MKKIIILLAFIITLSSCTVAGSSLDVTTLQSISLSEFLADNNLSFSLDKDDIFAVATDFVPSTVYNSGLANNDETITFRFTNDATCYSGTPPEMDTLLSIFFETEGVVTDEGVGVGSTKDDILREYGPVHEFSSNDTHDYYSYYIDEYMYQFSVIKSTGEVNHWRIEKITCKDLRVEVGEGTFVELWHTQTLEQVKHQLLTSEVLFDERITKLYLPDKEFVLTEFTLNNITLHFYLNLNAIGDREDRDDVEKYRSGSLFYRYDMFDAEQKCSVGLGQDDTVDDFVRIFGTPVHLDANIEGNTFYFPINRERTVHIGIYAEQGIVTSWFVTDEASSIYAPNHS